MQGEAGEREVAPVFIGAVAGFSHITSCDTCAVMDMDGGSKG